jgi:hypothetical protein
MYPYEYFEYVPLRDLLQAQIQIQLIYYMAFVSRGIRKRKQLFWNLKFENKCT